MVQLPWLLLRSQHILLVQSLLPEWDRVFKRGCLADAAQAVLAEVGELAHVLTLLALDEARGLILLIRRIGLGAPRLQEFGQRRVEPATLFATGIRLLPLLVVVLLLTFLHQGVLDRGASGVLVLLLGASCVGQGEVGL